MKINLSVRTWLKTIPKVSSHYSRSKTTLVYVDDQYKTKTNLLKIYMELCKNNDFFSAKRKVFWKILDVENILIFINIFPLFYVLYKKYKRYISISIQHDDMVLVQITCKNLFEVEQYNLERGHSIMEADSVHSTLERLFNSPIYTSWDYLSRIRQARQFQSY